jgi:hypothetical protein
MKFFNNDAFKLFREKSKILTEETEPNLKESIINSATF